MEQNFFSIFCDSTFLFLGLPVRENKNYQKKTKNTYPAVVKRTQNNRQKYCRG